MLPFLSPCPVVACFLCSISKFKSFPHTHSSPTSTPTWVTSISICQPFWLKTGKKIMGSRWRKLKLALGLDSCVHIPRACDDSSTATTRFPGDVSPTVVSPAGDTSGYRPFTPTPLSSTGIHLTPKSQPQYHNSRPTRSTQI